LRCANPNCGRVFVPQFVVEQSAGEGESGPKRPARQPAPRSVGQVAAKSSAVTQWAVPVSAPAPEPKAAPFATPVQAPMARPVATKQCPRCGKPLDPNAIFCLSCGTNLESGRRLVRAKAWDKAADKDALESGWLGVWSVFVPVGLVPYASEASLRRPPLAVLAVVVACFLCFPIGYSEWGRLNLFQWSGDPAIPVPRPPELPADFEMPPVSQFAWYQLFTSQFLHGGVEHLIMNMLALLVVGPKVNDLLGHARFLVSYLTLGVISGLAPLFVNMGSHPVAGLGASGSIMGIAGMYLVFSPQPRVRMAFWLRFFLFTPPFLELFRLRGIWLVLILFSMDFIAVLLGNQDGVGHDVHLTGFAVGSMCAAMLVALRWVRCGGYDLLTWLLGQEDVEQDRDHGRELDDDWTNVANAAIVQYLFLAVFLFGGCVFVYHVVHAL
jgi:membrane associated rhomboid family serine protease